MTVPQNPNIYHIVHFDRLPHIIEQGRLLCDSAMTGKRPPCGTTIGMPQIKERRLKNLLSSYPNLRVGNCVPFYFCTRSVMLYVIHKKNAELIYKGGQEKIVYLEAELRAVVKWAEDENLRYAFTTSNAGSSDFEDYSELKDLNKIDWDVIGRNSWWDGESTEEGKNRAKEKRQAEFLVEKHLDWKLISNVYTQSSFIESKVLGFIEKSSHKPNVQTRSGWYYRG
ncbi:MAG: type II toxin-antitoxin system toxin DNA ADP-ribosyl transferase DarT [Thermodesulfobacteriota bacterium]